MAFPFLAVEEMLLALFCVCDLILVAISLPALLKSQTLTPMPTFAMFLATFSFAVFAISIAFKAYSHVRYRYPISRRNVKGTWTFGIIFCLALVAIIHAGIRATQVGICQDYTVLPSSCGFGAITLSLWCLIALISVIGGVVSYLHVESAFKITPYPTEYQATTYSPPSYPQRAYRPGAPRGLGRSLDSERLSHARV